MNIYLKNLSEEDVDQVVNIHCISFPDSIATQLGRFVVRRYYLWQLHGPHEHYSRGALLGDRLVGFCISGVSRGAFSGFVQKNLPFLGWTLMTRPQLWFRPKVWHLIRLAVRFVILRKVRDIVRSNRRPNKEKSRKVNSWGVLAIAVLPDVRGTGVASCLMEDAELEAKRRGYTHMHLTVEVHNRRAIRFYEKMGWERVIVSGSWNGRMEKILKV